MLLAESGIRLPKGTKAAKILYHDDMDGISSAKIVHDQLVQQGIPSKNIKMFRVTDSTEKEREEELLQKRPGQMLIAVDFDRFKNKELAAQNLDFHTDHHETEQRFSRGGGGTGDTQFRSDTEHLATKHGTTSNPEFAKNLSYVDSADFGDDFKTSVLKRIDPKSKTGSRMRRLAMITNTIVSQLTRSKANEPAAELLAKQSKQSIPNFYMTARNIAALNNLQKLAIDELKKDSPNMNMVDKIRSIVKQKGSQEMANAIQKGNPQNIRHINMPESLSVKDLSDIELMQKKFETGERIKNTPDRRLQKTEPEKAPSKPVKPKKPIKKNFPDADAYKKANDAYKDAMDEWQKAMDEHEAMYPTKPRPPSKSSTMKRSKIDSQKKYDEVIAKYQKAREDYEKKMQDYQNNPVAQEREEKEKAFKDYKQRGEITQEGNVVVQNIMGRGQPGRYTNYLLKLPNPIDAQVRQWATFVQMALAPDAPPEVKENVDLGKLMREALKEVRDEMGTKYEDWAFDIIEQESGGHKGITNISGLGTIGIMPKKLREELNDLKNNDKYKRYKALPLAKQRSLSLPGVDAIQKRIDELEDIKKQKAGRRQQIIREIKKKLIDKANAAIAEARKNMKEEYIEQIKYLAEVQ